MGMTFPFGSIPSLTRKKSAGPIRSQIVSGKENLKISDILTREAFENG